ncbi:MAG: hypothetical protein AW08_01229 [Candidatus Accumulibacter adjunctus]|uniref:Uncharacterized protein n=1 Tax=Candidatus Accumulibacter adjunctus TaxID=1454001 RepID=A0A011NV46_9PROT|nr:MAG: hypothetical protein AW08_01229 [Candidatus Accumulibacter adjunctus]
MLLQLAPDEQVEFLVGAAEFDIGVHRHRVITLAQRVEQFVNRDRLTVSVTLGKVVALEHAGDGVQRCQTDHPRCAESFEPGRVEADLRPAWVEDLEYLFLVGLRIVQDLLARQRWAGDVLAGRVADHAGEVADQEHDVVAEVLEVSQLVDQYGMSEVQVGCRRIETGLDAQWAPALQLVPQFRFDQELLGAAPDLPELIVHCAHAVLVFVHLHGLCWEGIESGAHRPARTRKPPGGAASARSGRLCGGDQPRAGLPVSFAYLTQSCSSLSWCAGSFGMQSTGQTSTHCGVS